MEWKSYFTIRWKQEIVLSKNQLISIFFLLKILFLCEFNMYIWMKFQCENEKLKILLCKCREHIIYSCTAFDVDKGFPFCVLCRFAVMYYGLRKVQTNSEPVESCLCMNSLMRNFYGKTFSNRFILTSKICLNWSNGDWKIVQFNNIIKLPIFSFRIRHKYYHSLDIFHSFRNL